MPIDPEVLERARKLGGQTSPNAQQSGPPPTSPPPGSGISRSALDAAAKLGAQTAPSSTLQWEAAPENTKDRASLLDRLQIDAGLILDFNELERQMAPGANLKGAPALDTFTRSAAARVHPTDPSGATEDARGELIGAAAGAIPIVGPARKAGWVVGAVRGGLAGAGSGLLSIGAQTAIDHQWDQLKTRAAWAGALGSTIGGLFGSAEGAVKQLAGMAAAQHGFTTLDDIAAATPGGEELAAFVAEAADKEAKLAVLAQVGGKKIRKGLVRHSARMGVGAVRDIHPITVSQWKALPIDARIQYMLDAGVEEDVARKLAAGAPTAPFVELRRLGKAPVRMLPRAAAGTKPPLNEAMAVAARDAYLAKAIPDANGYYPISVLAEARKAAAAAAHASGRAQIDAINNSMQAAAKLRDISDPKLWRKNGELVWQRVAAAARDMLSRQASEFGTAGKPLAGGLGRQDIMADRLAGEWEVEANKIINDVLGANLSGLRKVAQRISGTVSGVARRLGAKIPLTELEQRRHQVGQLIEGTILPSDVSPQVHEAADKVTDLLKAVHLMAEDAGLRQDYAPLSRAVAHLANNAERSYERLRAALKAKDSTGLRGEVKVLYDAITQLHGEIVTTSSGTNVLVPTLSRDHFFPHYGKPAAIKDMLTGGTARNLRALERIKRTENITDDAVAQAKLREYFKEQTGAPGELRGGSLQWSRDDLLDPSDIEQDISRWLPKYLYDSSRRIAGAKVWGGKDEVAEVIWSAMAREGGNVSVAKDIWNATNGRGKPVPALAKMASRASDVLLLGPGTALLQFLQLGNSAAAFGFRNTIKGMLATMRSPELRELVARSGATLPDMAHAIAGDPFSETSTAVLKAFGITAADRAARVSSGSAGAMRAAELITKLVRRGLGKLSRAELHEMEFLNMPPPQDILTQGGKLSPEQLKQVILAAANKTQFASHVSDLPWGRTQGGWQLVYKFKTFALQQSSLINEFWIRGAKYGDWRPLMRYAAAVGVGSQTVVRAREMMKRNPKDQTPVQLMTSALVVGSMGALGDGAAAASQTGRLGGWAVGPAVGLVEKPFVAGSQLLHGDVGGAARTIAPNAVKNAINLYENLNK